jgi:hypothetical protein
MIEIRAHHIDADEKDMGTFAVSCQGKWSCASCLLCKVERRTGGGNRGLGVQEMFAYQSASRERAKTSPVHGIC